MAEYSLSSGSIMRPGRFNHATPVTRHFQLSTAAATAIIVRGDVVQFDDVTTTSNFRIRRAEIGTTVVSTGILGVAAGNSTDLTFNQARFDGSTTGLSDTAGVPTKNFSLPVYLADPNNCEFIVWSTGTLQSSWVNTRRALRRDSTLNIWQLDPGNSTALDQRVIVTELFHNQGDTNGQVYVKFVRNIQPNSSVANTNTFVLALNQ